MLFLFLFCFYSVFYFSSYYLMYGVLYSVLGSIFYYDTYVISEHRSSYWQKEPLRPHDVIV